MNLLILLVFVLICAVANLSSGKGGHGTVC